MPYFIISDFSGLGDPLYVDFALRIIATKIWTQGVIPLINHYNFYGDTIAGKFHPGVFYPLNFIYLLFPPMLNKKIITYVHYVIIAVGMYLFLRSLNISKRSALFSSLFYSTNPVGYHFALPGLNTYAWLPWIFYFSHKTIITNYNIKAIIWLSVIISVSFLAGHPQIWVYIILICSLYFLVDFVLQKRLSFKIIKLIFIILFIFILICGLQILLSYLEFKYYKRFAINICQEFEKGFPFVKTLPIILTDYVFAGKLKNHIFYTLYGFFFPLYLIEIIILFIFKKFEYKKNLLLFFILSLILSIGFIGKNPCSLPLIQNFQHNNQFLATLYPMIIALMIAFVVNNRGEKNNKLLISSFAILMIIVYLIPSKKFDASFYAEIVVNFIIIFLLFVYNFSQRRNIFFIAIFITTISYNTLKTYNMDKSLYSVNWYEKAKKEDAELMKKQILKKNFVMYSDEFVFDSPYKRYLNALFGVKNFRLNTFDGLIPKDVSLFYEKLLYNKFNIENFKYFGVKYLFLNSQSIRENIGKYFSTKEFLSKGLIIKKIVSNCISKEGIYYLAATKDNISNVQINCLLAQYVSPESVFYLKKDNLIINNIEEVGDLFIFLIKRDARIFLYNKDRKKFEYFDNLPAYLMWPFVLNRLFHSEVLREEIQRSDKWSNIYTNDDKTYEIWEYKEKVFPEAWFVYETKFLKDEDFYNILGSEDAAMDKVGFVNDKNYVYKFIKKGIDYIYIQEKKAHKLRGFLKISNRAILVIRNNWDICWSAKLDKRDIPLFKINGFMQGVMINAGEHNLELNCNISNLLTVY